MEDSQAEPVGSDLEKKCTVMEDVKRGLFSLIAAPHKRTGKHRQLQDDVFNSVYAKNITGFATANLVKWLIAVEQYIEKSDTTRCRWRYQQDSSGIHTSAHLLLNPNLLHQGGIYCQG